MIFPEYESFDALGLAGLIRRGDIHRREVLAAAIERIEEWNPVVNAVVHKMYDQAKSRLNDCPASAPFARVPFLLKDLAAHYKDVPTGSGSIWYRQLLPRRHSTLTQRYLDAGLVILGKTNTPELGLSGTTESVANGPTRNPWDLTRSPGGSSGGSAAAVSSGMVPMAHGTDTGGSIRNPASNCGLFGLKPTRHRVPMGPGGFDTDNGHTVMHALTRSVRDSAALLDVSCGATPTEPEVVPRPATTFLTAVDGKPGTLRIGYHAHPHHNLKIHPECVRTVERTARLLENLGHIVEEHQPEIDGERIMKIYETLWPAGVFAEIETARRRIDKPPKDSGLEWMTRRLADAGKEISSKQYRHAVDGLREIAATVTAPFDTFDMILSPVLSRPPWPLDQYENAYTDIPSYVETVLAYSPFSWPYNISGQPAMSVPLHRTPDGLPVGVMFAGRYGEEAALFRLASQLEEARPWMDARPPRQVHNRETQSSPKNDR